MASDSAGIPPERQFRETTKLVEHASGGMRKVPDYFLTRYACYLIAMNGDPAKPEIGAAQTYFAVQTRRQELFDQMSPAEKRVQLRERVRNANKALNGSRQNPPVFRDTAASTMLVIRGCMEVCVKRKFRP